MSGVLVAVLGLLAADPGSAGVIPAIRPVRTHVLPGEPVLLRMGVRNGTAHTAEWAFTADGAPAFDQPVLEWSIDGKTWKPCVMDQAAAPAETKLRRVPAKATIWASGDFLQADRLCDRSNEVTQASFRLRVGTAPDQQTSEPIRVQLKHGGDAGITGPESWNWGFANVRLSGARQCAVWLPQLDWKKTPEPSQRHNRQYAGELESYLRRFPEFPFQDCLRLNRASALAGGGDTKKARQEFESLRSSTKDDYIKEQCSTALRHL